MNDHRHIVATRESLHRLFLGAAERITYLGFTKKCPICKLSSRKFATYGIPKRDNARCIWCGCLERHRLIWLFFQRRTNLFNRLPLKMLHIAPEKAFIKPLSRYIREGYITADLNANVMLRVDITKTSFPDNTFDVILCSHVLEHIVDDKTAITELLRILKVDGWALIVVPISREKTFEDNNIINSDERLRVYGQIDHVRICGVDYCQRLISQGFNVRVFKADEIATQQEHRYYGLATGTIIYFCTKGEQVVNLN